MATRTHATPRRPGRQGRRHRTVRGRQDHADPHDQRDHRALDRARHHRLDAQAQGRDDGRDGLRSHHDRPRPRALPVRHARPGPLRLHVGDPRRGDDRLPAARRRRPRGLAGRGGRHPRGLPQDGPGAVRRRAQPGRRPTTTHWSRSVRTRLEIPGDVAILACDATDKESVKNVLLALLYAVLDEVEAQAVRV